MPRDTFFNLPPDKRDRFVAAALAEFSSQPYDVASITRVVASLGIAKGSVYQYFEDKFDLFRWLLEESGRRKLAALGAAPEHSDPVERLSSLYAHGLRWWVAEPAWARLGLRLLEPSAEPRLEVLRREVHRASLAFVVDLLGDRDPALAPVVLAVLRDGLLGAFLHGLGLRDLGELDGASLDEARVAEATDRAVALVLGLLRRGL